MSKKVSFSIIVFAYNEGPTLFDLICKTKRVLEQVSNDFEIIIVDDGSTDITSSELERVKKHVPMLVITHKRNRGIGYALKSGYLAAKNDFVCAIPGDAQFDVEELLSIPEFDEKNCYSFYREQTGYSLYRQFLSSLNRLSNKYLFGIELKDVNWIKVYHKKHLERIDFNLNSSLIESEICGKLNKLGVLFIEYPSKYIDREAGLPKGGSFKTVSKAAIEFFKLAYEVMRFRP